MNNRVKYVSRISILAILVGIISLGISSLSIYADTIELHRVYTYMPDIKVEVSGITDVKQQDISGKLGGQLLTTGNVQKYDSTIHSSNVIVLLDISKDNKDFEQMKDSLIKLISESNENTHFEIYEYGKDINKVVTGDEGRDRIIDIIKSLKKSKKESHTYNSIVQIYQAYYQMECQYDRQYLMLFSSITDNNIQSMSSADAKKYILDKSMPVYAFVPKTIDKKRIDKMASFTSRTGGNIQLFNDENYEKSITVLKQNIDNVYLVSLSANTNKTENKKKLLTLQIKDKFISENIRIINSKDDNTIPQIKQAEYDKEKNAIIIIFSEPMIGAEYSYNFSLKNTKNQELTIERVEYNKAELKSYLYIREKIYSGKYKLSVKNITDDSQNRNSLVYDNYINITNAINRKGFWEKYWWIFVLALLAIAAVVVTIVLIIVGKRNKGNDRKKIEEISQKIDDSQKNLVKEVEGLYFNRHGSNQSIRINKGIKTLSFKINMKNRIEQKVELEIVSSIIVGRSKECELSIDDSNMSRQHFAIEEQNNNYVIFDLNSKNGTYLNGTYLNGKRILRSNDKISAGATEFIVTYK